MTSSPPPDSHKMPLIQETQEHHRDEAALAKERIERIRVKNRRKLYLDRHPSYFNSPDLELAGALFLLAH